MQKEIRDQIADFLEEMALSIRYDSGAWPDDNFRVAFHKDITSCGSPPVYVSITLKGGKDERVPQLWSSTGRY